MITQKCAWRKVINAQNRALKAARVPECTEDRERFDAGIKELLERVEDPRSVGAFLPMWPEPSFTVPLPCWLPVQTDVDEIGRFGWAEDTAAEDPSWTKLKFGFPQLRCEETRLDPPLKIILVPAIAVDYSRTRLGRGKGWYDRALARLQNQAQIWVVINHRNVYPAGALPASSHDVPVTGAVTEKGLITF